MSTAFTPPVQPNVSLSICVNYIIRPLCTSVSQLMQLQRCNEEGILEPPLHHTPLVESAQIVVNHHLCLYKSVAPQYIPYAPSQLLCSGLCALSPLPALHLMSHSELVTCEPVTNQVLPLELSSATGLSKQLHKIWLKIHKTWWWNAICGLINIPILSLWLIWFQTTNCSAMWSLIWQYHNLSPGPITYFGRDWMQGQK